MKPRQLFIAMKDFTGETRVGREVKVSRGSLLSQEEACEGSPDGTFWARVLDIDKVVRVPPSAIQELSRARFGLLEAVTNGDERLELFQQERLMHRLSALQKGDPVRVQITSASGQKVQGIIRYRGPIDKSKHDTSIIFGVELVGSAAGKGFTNGSFKGQKFFSCSENCGVFVPVNRIEPDDSAEGSPLAPKSTIRECTRIQLTSGDPLLSPELEIGDRVFFKMDDSTPTGTVLFCDHLPKKLEAGVFVGIRLDKPIGSWDGYFKGQLLCKIPSPEYGMLLPISKVHKEQADRSPESLASSSSLSTSDDYEDCPSPSSIRYPPRMEECAPREPLSLLPSADLEDHKKKRRGSLEKKKEEEEEEENGDFTDIHGPYSHHLLEINSMVEVNNPPIYGVIRWIGELPDVDETIAGLELEEPLPSGCTDGQYRGVYYFHCQPNKALFVKLRHCRPDSRFGTLQNPENPISRCNSLDFRVYASSRVEENTPPPPLGTQGMEHLSGWKKGIQGHCNSCYLDATLFCMFTFTSVLDSMLLRPADENDGECYIETRDLLRTEIVNPLRKNGYVCATKIMALRKVLETAGHSSGFTSEEKDPEEFLTLLFQVLKMEPLFQIRSAHKDPHGCIFYQIFVEDHSTRAVPTVQELLEGSLITGDLKFTEAPSCLILQMPRNGKNFKAFRTIQPSLELDLTDLLEETLRECCICQGLAVTECPDCYKDPNFGPQHIRQFCRICCQQVHKHQARRGHHPRPLHLPEELSCLDPLPEVIPRQTMQLFGVLCIETSHYVAFTRHGPDVHQWLFFDSMADREGGLNGFNIPRVTPCSEVADFLEMSPEELQRLDPKSLPTYARRLLCDAYMCFYHSPSLGLYK
ncbi:ubiquitin carboxyl-terminal hydrolase CYLD-like isoform X1 [Varanus komodoensis]|uniref:ubiquitin carboxyl-terminal hydrolase CYLD-like isoform X1 n=1 Tax=Varanus komodoensis TaxID=61221 RepID=UPI001CF7C50A|nr:ubiquitin carboxyl-terminal hydrolase CYLD-like isoform X1 [Varanus komodoensis]